MKNLPGVEDSDCEGDKPRCPQCGEYLVGNEIRNGICDDCADDEDDE